MSTRTRRLKWHPSPETHNNFPSRRRKTRTAGDHEQPAEVIPACNYKGKLGSLFGVERELLCVPNGSMNSPERREVAAEDDGGGGGGCRWRFQAEELPAECDFLKMERLKKVEKNGVGVERRLKSAVKSFDSGRKKLCEEKNIEMVLKEEMKELSKKLEELQKCKKEIKKECNGEVNGDCSILTCKSQHKSTAGMLDGMEKDFGSIINHIDFVDHLTFSNRFSNHGKDTLVSQEASNKCSGRCKLLVKRMVEQVRAETEQWSQMQEMLGQLRQEMEELQTSKDFWEAQALASNQEIQSLMFIVEEWREKAIEYETKAKMLQTKVNSVTSELEKFKKDQRNEIDPTSKKTIISLSKQIERETKIGLSCRMKIDKHEKIEQSTKNTQPLSLGKQLAMEKRILTSRSKENRPENYQTLSDSAKSNSSSSSSSTSTMGIVRQYSNAIFPLHFSESLRMKD